MGVPEEQAYRDSWLSTLGESAHCKVHGGADSDESPPPGIVRV